MTTKEIQSYLKNPEKPTLRYFPFQVADDLSDLAAVMLYDLHKRVTGRKKPQMKGGYNWVFDALSVFAENHPYASTPGIRKAFLALAEHGLIRIEKTGKYNKKKYDGKWWYALTEDGEKRVAKRLMRFRPDVATSSDITKESGALGIPTAVILEHFRQQLHKDAAAEYVTIKPSELRIPYSVKTIGRHLDGIVANGILERDAENDDRYRILDKWNEADEPLTVPTSKLLPLALPGSVCLLTAPSGTAKTSLSTFMAVQHALAGVKVVYVTLEEPAINIIHRMYAQEFGVSYSDLHRADRAASDQVEAKMKAGSERMAALAKNLKIIDLHGQRPTAAKILGKIAEYQPEDFTPHMLFIDQLEFSSAEVVNVPGAPSTDVDDAEVENVGIDLPLAIALSEAFRGRPFKTWVLHQVDGNPRPEFMVKDIAGGQAVAECFDVVLGIGRTNHDELATRVDVRVFSLTARVEFETTLEVDFPHMRFKPKKSGRK